MVNKYLKELGVKEEDYPFEKLNTDNRYIPDDSFLSDSDTWDLRTGLEMVIYTYLRKFKDTKRISYPARMTEDKWEEILDDMIKGFASMIKGEESHRAWKRQKKALALFKTYFFDLWW